MSPFTHCRRLALLATALAVLPSCGGGGGDSGGPGPGPTPTPQLFTIYSEAARDGYAGSVAGIALSVADLGNPSRTGDNGAGLAFHQFFSFDVSALPAGATVQSAALWVFQEAVAGTPYTTHGVVIVDHLVYDVLDGADFNGPALTGDIGTLSTTPALELKTLDVTAQVLADLAAARTRSQFRVRWSIADDDGDAEEDVARFTDAEDLSATGHPPYLLIIYTLP